MSGDWIKMRGNLWDDPRVSKICDLTDQSEAAVVGALYWLWATADQHTEDGILPGLTLRQIDRKTGVPGFAQALCNVGWLADHPEGVRIIRFEEHNGASAKKRCQTAKRVANHAAANAELTQAALANEQSSVSSPLAREEKRREEEKTTPPIGGAPPADDAKPPAKAKADHGTRLPADWTLPDTWAAEARRILAELNRPDIQIPREAEKFRDHWIALPGQAGRKSDWLGTWRNWVRKAVEFQRGPPSAKPSAIHIGKQDYAAGWGK